MKKGILVKIFLVVFLTVFLVPTFVFAQQITLVPDCPDEGCGWPQLMELAQNIMTFLIAISIPLASIAFAWAGFLYITARGSQSAIDKAHSIFGKVAIGFIVVLTAWLIVWLITSSLLEEDYILLER